MIYTVDEFETYHGLPENRDRLLELIHGEIVEKLTTQLHGVILGNLIGQVGLYLRDKRSARIGGHVQHRVLGDASNVRQPDFSANTDLDRPIIIKGSVPHMPHWAAEIQLPNQTEAFLREKATYYLENGCQLVWLIYPEKSLVEVYHANGETDFYTLDDTLDGGRVLPEFEVAVRDIFEI